MFVTESQVLGFITLGVTTISSIVTGYPTVLHAQFIAVVGQSRAAGENSHQRTDPMAQIVSPFWSLGSTAVAAGNIVIIIVVIVVHAVVTKLGVLGGGGGNDAATGERKGSVAPGLGLQQQPSGGKGVELPDTWVIHRFPELSYVIALTFYQGLVNAAFSIFYHSDGPVFVIGTVCLLLTVALPLLLYYLLYRFLAGAWPPYRAVTFSHAFGWAFPHGYWSAGRVKRCFGRIFASTTDRGVRFTGYPLLLVLLVNAASNVQAVDKQQRDAQFGVLGLLFVVSAIFVAVSRPHRSNVTNVVYVISFTMLMILCVCLANEATNAGAADGVPVVIVVLEVLLWANGVYEIAVWFAEMRGVLHAARKAHMQGDESGTMRTRTVGARADAKKAAAARSAFVADEDNFLQTPNIASKTAASHQQESDESDDERRVRPLLLSSPSDDMTSSPVSVSSPFYVEMSSSPPLPPLNARHEDQHSSPFYATTFEVPTVQVPAPGKVAVAPPVVELTPQRQPPPSQQQAAASPPPPSPPPQDGQDDFLDMFAAAPPPAPAANKPPPSFGLLQRAQDESLVSKASKTAVGAKKPPAPPPGTKSGKPSSSKKKQKQSTSRRRGGSSSSSSDDIFGSDSDDSDL
ncbi:transmembrane protein, putative [Bodo saltans]|nr:transmembrane protein, putative [Bodo saltans]|eukprot:CUE74552.1 transmembrane protein, putative [Bodo saltans]